MKGPTSPWNDDTEAALKRLWEAGRSCSEIATEMNAATPGLGLSRNSVVGRAHRMGLTRRMTATDFEARTAVKKQREREKADRRAARANKTLEALERQREPKPMPKAEPLPENVVPFLARTRFQCWFSVDDAEIPGTAETPCCGAPVEMDGLCEAHRAIVRRPRPERQKRTGRLWMI